MQATITHTAPIFSQGKAEGEYMFLPASLSKKKYIKNKKLHCHSRINTVQRTGDTMAVCPPVNCTIPYTWVVNFDADPDIDGIGVSFHCPMRF
jgi:hypothetical protein